jgi:hypothetical protein
MFPQVSLGDSAVRASLFRLYIDQTVGHVQ